MFRKFTAGVLVGALLLTAAACGDDGAEADVSAAGDSVAADAPRQIVSMTATATEMLYAIGAGEQVIAVDNFSNYPPETADKMVGIDAYQPSIEAIAGLEPDLVITDGTNPDLLSQFDSLDIPHWEGVATATVEEAFDQIEELGEVVGRPDEATRVADGLRERLDAALAAVPEPAEPLTYYHELDNTYFTVTSESFIGDLYSRFGLVNIADAAGTDSAYPQLSAEYILEEDPDLIFLACTKFCNETAATVAARPGWDVVSAVRNGGVIEMDDDIASRWGPRIIDYVEAVAAAVEQQAALQLAG